MYDITMPLYPSISPGCGPEACVRVPVFGADRCARPGPLPVRECRKVIIENPCRPGECAEVLLGVDACGNLAVCVRRAPGRDGCDWDEGRELCERPRRKPCCRPAPRCDGGRGRLYGSWH